MRLKGKKFSEMTYDLKRREKIKREYSLFQP